MNRTFTLICILFLSTIVYCSKLSAAIINDPGTSTNYNLGPGDSLTIISGTYTGTITGFSQTARITVLSGATFQPNIASFPWSNVRGHIYVHGTFKFSGTLFRTNNGFRLYNYNTTWLTGSVQMDGGDQLWTNYFGGNITIDGNTKINGGFSTIVNSGAINMGANFEVNGTSRVINKNNLFVTGYYQNDGGDLLNQGRFQVTGSIRFNNGTSVINNYCRLIAYGGITNTSQYFNNYSYMWARAENGLGNITNSGTITNGPIARIHAVNFTNTGNAALIPPTGVVKGAGYLYFTGVTTMTGGIMGAAGITSDTIRFYDVTRTNAATIFDVQSGGIRNPNFVYRVFPAPDSLMAYIPGCATELASEIPLATQWNYFYVNLSNNIPSLNWSTQHEAGTSFAIERSYDNINFSLLDIIPALANKNAYSYNDATVNTMNGIAYYRIKAIEPTGAPRLSVVRSVKFSAKSGMIVQATPNPFTSQFNLSYQSQRNEKIAVEVFNMAGQLQFSKTIAVANGFNVIGLPESQRLDKGLYLVRVSNETGLLSSEKVIRQ